MKVATVMSKKAQNIEISPPKTHFGVRSSGYYASGMFGELLEAKSNSRISSALQTSQVRPSSMNAQLNNERIVL